MLLSLPTFWGGKRWAYMLLMVGSGERFQRSREQRILRAICELRRGSGDTVEALCCLNSNSGPPYRIMTGKLPEIMGDTRHVNFMYPRI